MIRNLPSIDTLAAEYANNPSSEEHENIIDIILSDIFTSHPLSPSNYDYTISSLTYILRYMFDICQNDENEYIIIYNMSDFLDSSNSTETINITSLNDLTNIFKSYIKRNYERFGIFFNMWTGFEYIDCQTVNVNTTNTINNVNDDSDSINSFENMIIR